jgi:hypothetical protein
MGWLAFEPSGFQVFGHNAGYQTPGAQYTGRAALFFKLTQQSIDFLSRVGAQVEIVEAQNLWRAGPVTVVVLYSQLPAN